MLSQRADIVLPLPLKASLVAYCPTMDLIAVTLQDDEVQVYRLSGQKVFAVTQRKDKSTVTALCWKPNGRTLAVAYSSNIVLLVSAHSGKIISQATLTAHSTKPICSLFWGVNFMDPRAARALLEAEAPTNGSTMHKLPKAKDLLDDAVAKGFRDLDIDMPRDLPTDLGNLDVETSLPKLSTLPPGGKDEDVFAGRASLDALFHTAKKDDNDKVDVLMAGFEDGSVYLSLYDSFEIGLFEHLANDPKLKVVRYCNHPYTSSYVCLVTDNLSSPDSLSLVPVDLKLIPDTGRYLPLLASKSAQLKNLVRYMKQSVVQIRADYHTSQDLPRRFMRNVEEDLENKEHNNLVSAAYHLAATGQSSAVLKEWLIDELGERGYRRWEKAATLGYEGVCRYTFQNLLPALDRFAIILSRVRGLSRFYEASSVHGLSTPELDRIFDTLSCLRLMIHTIMNIAGTELRNFTAFAKWLKLEIEVQGTDPLSTSVDEFPASYATLNYPAILDFIEGAMQQSELAEFCEDKSEKDAAPAWYENRTEGIYPKFRATLTDRKGGEKVPSLEALISRLELLINDMFRGIAQAQKRKVRIGHCMNLEEKMIGPFDITMLFDKISGSSSRSDVYVAVGSVKQSQVTVKQKILHVTNGMSAMSDAETAVVRLPSNCTIQDVKFADSTTLIIAMTREDNSGPSMLAYVPYRIEEAGGHRLNPLNLSTDGLLDRYVRHRFERQDEIPKMLEINGRKDRRAFCVVKKSGLHVTVFDLDSTVDDAERMEIE